MFCFLSYFFFQFFFYWRIISLQNFVVFCQSSTWISHAAAAAKSLQSCPTLCDPMDGSPPGSPIPGILQARPLEWVAISFSSAWKWKVKVKLLSRVWLFETPWTAAYQAPPSMGFSRQEYWSGVPLPSPLVKLGLCYSIFAVWLIVGFCSHCCTFDLPVSSTWNAFSNLPQALGLQSPSIFKVSAQISTLLKSFLISTKWEDFSPFLLSYHRTLLVLLSYIAVSAWFRDFMNY